MTTHLAIWTTSVTRNREEVTMAFCTKMCRHRWLSGSPRIPANRFDKMDLDSYEFDETCANCGKLVPADPIWEEEIAGVTWLVAKIGDPR